MNPKVRKLIIGIGTGVIGIVGAILEYKFVELPLPFEVALDIVVMVGAYFGLNFVLPKVTKS